MAWHGAGRPRHLILRACVRPSSVKTASLLNFFFEPEAQPAWLASLTRGTACLAIASNKRKIDDYAQLQHLFAFTTELKQKPKI